MRERYQALIDATVTDEALLFPRVHDRYQHERPAVDLADRVGRMLRHACTTVPAYRELALDPAGDASPWTLLQRCPLQDRFRLQADLPDFCDDHINPDECRFGTTSGTSGVPVKVIHDFDHYADEAVLALDRTAAAGLPLRRRILQPMKTMPLPWVEYPSPLRWHSLVAEFGTSDASDASDLAALADRSARFEPDVVFGHPSDCVALADLLVAQGRTVRPRAIQTYGEHLSDANRAYLAQVFDNAPVYDSYGLYEFGTVAAQCREGRYHVPPQKAYLEVVDEDGAPVPDGAAGEIVVTGLSNHAMPLIRYRTFDTGAVTWDDCGCGAPAGQILTDLQGRRTGQVTLAGGRTVRTDALTRVLRHQQLQRFQTIVHGADRLEVRVYRAAGPLDAPVRARLHEQLTGVVGDGVDVEIRQVGPAEFEADGRRKHVDLVVRM